MNNGKIFVAAMKIVCEYYVARSRTIGWTKITSNPPVEVHSIVVGSSSCPTLERDDGTSRKTLSRLPTSQYMSVLDLRTPSLTGYSIRTRFPTTLSHVFTESEEQETTLFRLYTGCGKGSPRSHSHSTSTGVVISRLIVYLT